MPDALETAATCASEVDEAEPMLARGLALLGEWSFTHRRSFLRNGQGRGAERRGEGTGGRRRAIGARTKPHTHPTKGRTDQNLLALPSVSLAEGSADRSNHSMR